MTGAIAIVACYLMGAVPFGLIVGLVTRGIDIRKYGSGNIGASNVLRTLGLGPALLVFALDTLKGLFAVLLCVWLDLGQYWVVAGALLCVLGHSYSAFLGFRGGKGVATSLGVIIGLNWIIASISFGLWLVIVGITRYISVASVIAAASVPAQMVLWRSQQVPPAYQALAGIAAVAIAARHKSNFKRLLNGTEPRIGQRVQLRGGKGNEANG